MGQGTKRKRNDSIRINRPKVSTTSERGGGGSSRGGGHQRKEDINQICPPTVKVRVKPGKRIAEGSPVTARHGRMFVFGDEIGVLPEKDARTLSECLKQGIEYRGRIVITNDTYYVRFEQPK